MDTFDFINTDWTHKLSEFDRIYDGYGVDNSEELWQEKPEIGSSVRYSRPSYWIKSSPGLDLVQLIADLRKPLLMMANGEAPFDPIKFQRITNEIQFYEWANDEMGDDDYVESFKTIYDDVCNTIDKREEHENERKRLEREIELRQARLIQLQEKCTDAKRFQMGARKLMQLKSVLGKQLAMVLIVEIWRSNKREIRELYLSTPDQAIETMEFILSHFMHYDDQKISALRKNKSEQEMVPSQHA